MPGTSSPRVAARTTPLAAATDALLVISRALVGVAARSLAATESELTLPQYRALVALSVNGEQNMSTLADALGLHPSTVTRLCDRLAEKGYLARVTPETNRREVRLTLTEKARALVRTETDRRRRAIRQIVSRLDEQTQLEIVDALGKLGEAAEELRGHAWKLGWTA